MTRVTVDSWDNCTKDIPSLQHPTKTRLVEQKAQSEGPFQALLSLG